MSSFSGETFRFLRELAENNDRDWFQDNKDRYEHHVKVPAQHFIVAVGERLDAVSPHLKADPRPVGGSLFRIHRDVRFSKDKRPYKTAAGIQFRHDQGKDVHAPGLYFHIEPRNCFVGLGIWHPDAKTLRAIREAIVERPEEWMAASRGGAFAESFELGGESLARGPKGFDLDHPLIEDIKRKDFIGVAEVPQSFVTASDAAERFVELTARSRSFLGFLCSALNVPF